MSFSLANRGGVRATDSLIMDVKLVKWEKETEQESIRFRLGFTRVMEMHIRTNQGLANAAIPRRISCRVSPLKAWYTCS
jgi:hypothetical protein